jgi:glycosyltransferase involved in cell wall biosynthesis
MARGAVDAAAFPFAVLETARIASLPGLLLRPVTDVLSDRTIAYALEKLVRTLRADVIHAQTEECAPAAALIARRLHLPFVVTIHGINTHPRYLPTIYQKRRLRPALSSAHRVILVGEPLHKFFESYLGTDRNFQVVPNGVDVPTSGFRQSKWDNGIRRIVSVGNLQEGKGLDIALLALAKLEREGISNWNFRVIGDGPEKNALRKLTTNLRLGEKVSFVGPVRHAEIFDHLGRNDIFVLPSYREAFGIAYLEAMAAGLLTIGVTGQGPSQFIRNGENGFLVPPRDVEALAAALRELLTKDSDRWCEIARQAQETVRNSYTWDSHARRLVAVYEDVIAKHCSEKSPESPGAQIDVGGYVQPSRTA